MLLYLEHQSQVSIRHHNENLNIDTLFPLSLAVPTMPQNLLVEYNSSTSLVVTWEHPLCDYGSRTSYNVSALL